MFTSLFFSQFFKKFTVYHRRARWTDFHDVVLRKDVPFGVRKFNLRFDLFEKIEIFIMALMRKFKKIKLS